MSGTIRRLGTIEHSLRHRLRVALIKARGIPTPPFRDVDLVYAAHHRCPCGAGLAYVKDVPLVWPEWGYWDCSDILTGRARPSGALNAVKHCAKYPFTFYDIKSERQPSAQGATTRPKP